MRAWEARLERLMAHYQDKLLCSESEIDDIIADPGRYWDQLWSLIAIKKVKAKLISRSFPMKCASEM